MSEQQQPPRTYPGLALGLAIYAVAAALAPKGVAYCAATVGARGHAIPVVAGLIALCSSVAAAVTALVLGLAPRQVAAGRIKSNIALVLALVATGLIVDGWLTPLLHPPHERNVQCLSNVKNVALALTMYVTDYDAYPPAAAWCDVLNASIIKNRDIYRCPQAPSLKSGQAYNDRLAGVNPTGLGNADRVVSVFESDRGWNAHGGGPHLLPPAPRHKGGDNYGFADGHVKWFLRDQRGGITWDPKVTPAPTPKPQAP